MTKHTIALTALLLASACGSRTAPANNAAATAPAPASQPTVPMSNSANSAAAVETKPAMGGETDNAGRAGGSDTSEGEEDTSAAAQQPRSPRGEQGCAAETSLGAAEELVRVCREVSPATRPPCNIQNSCATIREEINRSCRLLGADAPEDCRGG